VESEGRGRRRGILREGLMGGGEGGK